MLDETITVAYTCKPSTCDHESGKNRARMVARSSHGPCRNIIERGGDGMFVLCVPWCGEEERCAGEHSWRGGGLNHTQHFPAFPPFKPWK